MTTKVEGKYEIKKAAVIFSMGIIACALILFAAFQMSRIFFKTKLDGGSGLISCEDQETEELVKASLGKVGERIGKALDRKGEALFPWYGELSNGMDSYGIKGSEFGADGLSADQTIAARKIFEENGFILDRNNIAADSESDTFGYLSDRAACLITTRPSLSGDSERSGNDHSLTLFCGSLCDGSFSNIQDIFYLKKSIAEKRQLPIGEMSIDTIWKKDGRMKGEYRYDNPSGQPAVFYAVKTEGRWKVVYDRSLRPDCASLAGSGFSEEEVETCNKEEISASGR